MVLAADMVQPWHISSFFDRTKQNKKRKEKLKQSIEASDWIGEHQ